MRAEGAETGAGPALPRSVMAGLVPAIYALFPDDPCPRQQSIDTSKRLLFNNAVT
jgi:hypothetical protein